MKKFLSKKSVVALAVVAALVVSVAAYAYWTGTGSGSGTGQVATSNGTLSLKATFGDLVPGGPAKALTVKAWNTNSTSLKVGDISLDTSSDSDGISTSAVGCDSSWFDYTPPSTDNAVIAANTPEADAVTLTPTTAATISMKNTSSDQDACKGATITVHLASNSVPAP